MASDDKQPTAPNVERDIQRISSNQLPKRRAEGFRHVYANNINIRPNLFDFTLTFTHIKDSGDTTEPFINEEQVSIILSPHQFKAFVELGVRFLEEYEKENGPLNIESNKAPVLPPEIVARLQEALKKAGAAAAAPSPSEPSSTERQPPAKRSRGAGKKKAT